MKPLSKTDNKLHAERKYNPGEIREVVLAALGISVLVGGTIIFPPFPILFTAIMNLINGEEKGAIPRNKVVRTLKLLEKNELIRTEQDGENILVSVKEKGKTVVKKYSIRALLDIKKRSKKWDGKWYLVIFDIPEVQRNKRTQLRRLLKWIGFYQYQKSVFAFPFECEKEVKLIRDLVEGNTYTKYVVAAQIDDEDKLKIFFGL